MDQIILMDDHCSPCAVVSPVARAYIRRAEISVIRSGWSSISAPRIALPLIPNKCLGMAAAW